MIEADVPRRQLFRLVYASRFAGRERDLDEVLRAIIARSIQNNRQVDVTGFLIAGAGGFLQLLEGPREGVEETYARIGHDARHSDLVLIGAGHVERRLFRDWNMGQHRVSAADRALLSEVGLPEFEPARLDAETAVRLLKAAGARHLR